ncbi:MAG: hypothetical protein J6Z13_07545 [Clostridia bacterium]|nr:hypothetical protein [Clostridia bacterium]
MICSAKRFSFITSREVPLARSDSVLRAALGSVFAGLAIRFADTCGVAGFDALAGSFFSCVFSAFSGEGAGASVFSPSFASGALR